MKQFAKKSFFVIGILTVILMFGCRKKKPTVAAITVKNASANVVEDARVILYAVSSTGHQSAVTIHDTAKTSSNGQAYFNFDDVYQLGQAGVAVLNIKATKDNLMGEGIIKIEEEKNNSETVIIQ